MLITASVIFDVFQDVDVIFRSRKMNCSFALGIPVLQSCCVRQVQALEFVQISAVGSLCQDQEKISLSIPTKRHSYT